MRLCFFGTYDRDRPRTRVLLRGLRECGVRVTECWYSPWKDVRDKSQLRGVGEAAAVAVRYLAALPILVVRYVAHLWRNDAVVVPYLGQVDVVLAKLIALFARKPVVFVPHVSLHETVIEDRKMSSERGLVARLLRLIDTVAFRVSDLVVVDTAEELGHYARRFGLREGKAVVVPVGADDHLFAPLADTRITGPLRVLFYGTFIPLQGIKTILEAAHRMRDEPVVFRLIGKGQEYADARTWAERQRLRNVEWVPWVQYERLPEAIARANVSLGIFGETAKAGRVIPNKVFQTMAMGKPVVTGDYPVVRRYLRHGHDSLLVPPGDGAALAGALRTLIRRQDLRRELGRNGRETYLRHFSGGIVTESFLRGIADHLVIQR